jgi:hypothetical protein
MARQSREGAISTLYSDYLAEQVRRLSPAGRVRRTFIQASLWVSGLTFMVLGGSALLQQWIEGHAGAGFMFGTACLIAGACILLFAVIVAIGLAVSSAFSEE